MQSNYYFNPFIHYLIYLLAAVFFSISLDMYMLDDGLRHIAYAQNQELMQNWGTVFPFSLFSEYDPWYLWHKLLGFFLTFISYEKVHILVNSLSLFCLLILLDYHFRKDIKYNFASFTYIIIFGIVYLTSTRYLLVRPDLLSGLYVLAMLTVKNKFLLTFTLTAIYGPFYYLFFIYTGSLGLVYIIKKEWKSLIGTFIASVFVLVGFLLTDMEGYLSTIKYILTDQSLRMGLEVSEGTPIFDFLGNLNYYILLPLFLITSIVLIRWKYNFFCNNSIATFLVVTSILWVNQFRYFILFFPFIVLLLIELFVNSNKRIVMRKLRTCYVIVKKYASYSKKVKLFYLIAIPYSIFIFSYSFSTQSNNEKIFEASFFKDEVFNNKTILLNRLDLDIYKALYLNPSLKFVPSCSIGWFDDKDEKMKDIYIRMQKENGISEKELSSLIEYVGADFYIHYLTNEKQVLNFEKLKNFGIVADSINNNKIIFKISKER